MECIKGNLKIKLEEDKEKMKKEIKELDKLLEILEKNPQQCLLAGKTQLIGKEGNGKRSRQEHSNNLRNIAKQIIDQIYDEVVPTKIKESELYNLNLQIAEKYIEVMSITHDIGHTPYGHLGERVLNEFVSGQQISQKDTKTILEKRRKIFGDKYEKRQGHTPNYAGAISFEHNERSAEIVYNILQNSDMDLNIIDVNRIITGILAHSTSRVKEKFVPKDIIIQTIRRTDKIEYINKDLEEIKNYINIEAIEDDDLIKFIKKPINQRVKYVIEEIVKESIENGEINEKIPVLKLLKKLSKSEKEIISFITSDGKQGLILDENVEGITLMMKEILKYYMKNIDKIPTYKVRLVHPINDKSKEQKNKIEIKLNESDETDLEKLITFFCNMDDNQLKQTYMRLVKERITMGKGYGIEPISDEKIENLKEYNLSKRINKMKQNLFEDLEESEYSRDEYINLLKEENEQFINEKLTKDGKKKIIETLKKHNEENKVHTKLRDLMKEADSKRSEVGEGKISVSDKAEFSELVGKIYKEEVRIK